MAGTPGAQDQFDGCYVLVFPDTDAADTEDKEIEIEDLNCERSAPGPGRESASGRTPTRLMSQWRETFVAELKAAGLSVTKRRHTLSSGSKLFLVVDANLARLAHQKVSALRCVWT